MQMFIKLTLNCSTKVPVFVAIGAIEYIFPDGPTFGAVVSVVSHNNGGLKVMETPFEILRLISMAGGTV